MIKADLSRGVINARIARIKRVFRWAASEELIPATVVGKLETVAGLEEGRSEAREAKPVLPVPDEIVDKTLPRLPQVVADMVRLQRLTGCRPGEICALRPCDVDRTGEIWCYTPAGHKMEHLGRQRVIFIGPRAQQILLPYLLRDATAFCFSPNESEQKRKRTMRENRKTKVQPSQVNRAKKNPKRKPKNGFNTQSYANAIRRACRKAGIETWSPNRLRHLAATNIRKRFNLEAAQVVLGHANAEVTQLYAERDRQRAEQIMKEVG
jgi:integrase